MSLEINVVTLVLAFFIPIVIYFVLKTKAKDVSNDVIKAALIMTMQLSISAAILTFVFTKTNIIFTTLYLISMLFFSFRTLKKRCVKDFKFNKQAKISMSVSALSTLLYLLIILSVSTNVLSPRYIIPLFGMILGNTTTATILASNQINDILITRRTSITTLTNLGIPIRTALDEQLKPFIQTALTPTLASMLNIGVVSLPGMMTGQILAGELPITAVSYQMIIMFGILGSITTSILLLKFLTIKQTINSHNQLI